MRRENMKFVAEPGPQPPLIPSTREAVFIIINDSNDDFTSTEIREKIPIKVSLRVVQQILSDYTSEGKINCGTCRCHKSYVYSKVTLK